MASSEKRMLSLQSLRGIQVEVPRGHIKGVGLEWGVASHQCMGLGVTTQEKSHTERKTRPDLWERSSTE